MPFRHGRSTKLLVDGYDLSAFFREVSTPADIETLDATNFASTDKEYVLGFINGNLSAGGLWSDTQVGAVAADTADKHLFDALGRNQEASPLIASVAPGGWTIGNRVALVKGVEASYEVASSFGDLVSTSLEVQGDGPARGGYSLHDLTAETVIGNYASVDQGAAPAQTTKGAIAQLHVTAFTGTTLTVKVQHSADNVTFVDLVTFDAVTATRTAQRKQVSGNVERYVRAVTSAGTFTSATFQVGFARL